MASKKLLGLLMIPVAVGIMGGGLAVTQRVNAQGATPQATEQSTEKPEPGETQDKPGQADQQGQHGHQDATPDKPGQSDSETND